LIRLFRRSWRLVAHNDADSRGLWMAAQIGTQIDPRELLERKGTSADDADATLPYLLRRMPRSNISNCSVDTRHLRASQTKL